MEELNDLVRDNFEYGDLVYLYYSYINDFHVEPDSMAALFERSQFLDVLGKVRKRITERESK